LKERGVLIIGAGSLGCLIGAKMHLAEIPVIAIGSDKRAKQIQQYGLKLITTENESIKIPNFAFYSRDAFNVEFNADLIPIIAVKAYALQDICQQYNSILKNVPKIYLMQNGLGNEEIVRKYYPNAKMIRIITSNGAYLDDLGHVHHTGIAPTTFCNISAEENDQCFSFFVKAGFNPEISGEPQETIWRKALINIGINIFGALTRLQNGKLLNVSGLSEIMKQTIEEAYLVGKQKNIPLKALDFYDQLVLDIIERTKLNRNSMLQDILSQRKTELDFLNGYIIEQARELSIQTPINDVLVALLRGVEMAIKEK
jgi:2-dehydropantoate 2-reductase